MFIRSYVSRDVCRSTYGVSDVWEDGIAYKQLETEEADCQRRIKQVKDAVASSKVKPAGKAGTAPPEEPDLQTVAHKAALAAEAAELKAIEKQLAEKRKSLDAEKVILQLDLRRTREEAGVFDCYLCVVLFQWLVMCCCQSPH